MSNRKSDSFNEALKAREEKERDRLLNEVSDGEEKVMALDDTQRVKVLSPGRLVSKRFFRNKLALVGLAVLIIMFTFAFLCPLVYPYSQTEIFYKYDKLMIDYASASKRTEYSKYQLDKDVELHYSVANRINSYIDEMEEKGESSIHVVGDDNVAYTISRVGDKVYSVSAASSAVVATYSDSATIAKYTGMGKSFTWEGGEAMPADFQQLVIDIAANKGGEFEYEGFSYKVEPTTGKMAYLVLRTSGGISVTDETLDEDFAATAASAVKNGRAVFDYGDRSFAVRRSDNSAEIVEQGGESVAVVASTLVFNLYNNKLSINDEFKGNALLALYGEGSFESDGESYTIKSDGDDIIIYDNDGDEFAALSDYAIRRFSGEDTMAIDLKDAIEDTIEKMEETSSQTETIVFAIPAMDENAAPIYDENGELVYADSELKIVRHAAQYVVNCEQTTYLIDIHAEPTAEHWFGTDGDGMDILARAMYGGRISLMVGFVVVMIEMFLGIILGGLAGFFGGWVDTLIMRLVDIFYCIPSMPILIITGALFEQLKISAYVRLVYLMAILGILGWASVARLVRGQILSLREQEFMVAEEATGMRAAKRIFRHLIPNVMPQLIVSATMGLGSVIITESTLSFLGLGVKHPLATWGNMINSVTGSSEDMIRYAYIWVPIGALICLTVIAFNFVGDGLRDAFDPRSKQ